LVLIIGEQKKRPIERKSKSWSKPPEGELKINVDVAYDADQGKAGIGAIARDANGKFISVVCKESHFVTDATIAVAYALRKGVNFAQILG
jgi:hypothetical protein